MAPTILLAKVLGVFMIVIGAAVLLQRHSFAAVIEEFAGNRRLRTLFAAIELLAGLFLVAMHTAWDSLPAIIITLVGWLAVIESTAYLVLPDPVIRAFLLPFARPGVIAPVGVVALVLGLYLAAWGFGAA